MGGRWGFRVYLRLYTDADDDADGLLESRGGEWEAFGMRAGVVSASRRVEGVRPLLCGWEYLQYYDG